MKNFWITANTPEPNKIVLIRCPDKKLPVCPASYAGNGWKHADGSPVTAPIIAWMPLDYATALLDGVEAEIVPAFLKTQKKLGLS